MAEDVKDLPTRGIQPGRLVKFYPAGTKHWREEQYLAPRHPPWTSRWRGDNSLTKQVFFVILAWLGQLLLSSE